MSNRFHQSVRDELDERELQLAKEIEQLDQQHYNSRAKLRTEPAAELERRVLQLKPTTNCSSGYSSRGFKVSELRVPPHPNHPPMKKPVKHQFSSLIMGRTTAALAKGVDKENRSINIATVKCADRKEQQSEQQPAPQQKASLQQSCRRPPEKRIAKPENKCAPSLCRNLMKDFEPEHLFEPEPYEDNRLFHNDSLLLDYDSLEFDIKEETEPNS